MKKLILLLMVLTVAQSSQAYQQQQYQSQNYGGGNSSSSYGQQTKLYDRNGSLMGYSKVSSNGNVRYYNNYHQYVGRTYQQNSKTKWQSVDQGASY